MVQLRQNTDALLELGFQIIGISPDTPKHLRETIDKYRLAFALLHDRQMRAATAFGIAFNVVGKDDDYYAKLERASGEAHHMLPVPAVFIVGVDDVIKFQYVNPNYQVRLAPDLLVAAARSARKSTEPE